MHLLPSFSAIVERTSRRWSRAVAGLAPSRGRENASRDVAAAGRSDGIRVSLREVDLRVGDSLVFANSR
jgi:hypothetical protein